MVAMEERIARHRPFGWGMRLIPFQDVPQVGRCAALALCRSEQLEAYIDMRGKGWSVPPRRTCQVHPGSLCCSETGTHSRPSGTGDRDVFGGSADQPAAWCRSGDRPA